MIPSHRSALLTYFKKLAKRKYKLRCYCIANGSRTPLINGLRNTVMNVLENLERYHYVIKRSETLGKKTFLQQTGSSRPWMCSIVRNRKNFRNQSTSIEILTNLNAIINGLFTTLQGSKFIFGFGSTCATRCESPGALPKFLARGRLHRRETRVRKTGKGRGRNSEEPLGKATRLIQ